MKRVLRRRLFWLYGAALFTLTHWPNLHPQLPGRPDLLVHLTLFGGLTVLLIGAGFFGAPLSARNIGVCGIVGIAYAAVDEALQAIPWINRHAAWDDWAFDVLGVLCACGGAAVLSGLRARR